MSLRKKLWMRIMLQSQNLNKKIKSKEKRHRQQLRHRRSSETRPFLTTSLP